MLSCARVFHCFNDCHTRRMRHLTAALCKFWRISFNCRPHSHSHTHTRTLDSLKKQMLFILLGSWQSKPNKQINKKIREPEKQKKRVEMTKSKAVSSKGKSKALQCRHLEINRKSRAVFGTQGRHIKAA